jgi:hypothetical protein
MLVDEVLDDEKIPGKPHLLDHLQLVSQPFLQAGGDFGVSLRQALSGHQLEIGIQILKPGRGRKLGQMSFPELQVQVAGLGDADSIFYSRGEVGKQQLHLVRRFEVHLVVGESHPVGVCDLLSGLDAKQGIVRRGVFFS